MSTGRPGHLDNIFTPHAEPNAACPVGKNILGALQPRFDAAEQALQESLATTTIADIAEDIRLSVRAERANVAAGG